MVRNITDSAGPETFFSPQTALISENIHTKRQINATY